MAAVVAETFAARQLRRERRYRDALDPLNISDEELIQQYRFPRHEIISLCEELDQHISRRTKRSHAIPVHTQVLMTLRFLANGGLQSVIADSCGVTQASVSRVIGRVTCVLQDMAVGQVKMPSNIIDINKTVQCFHHISGFPRVIGIIDSTQIPIKAPNVNDHLFLNYSGYHSLNIQVVTNAENLITSYNVKYPGSTHASYVWCNSNLRTRFQAGTYLDTHLLGDIGYPLEPFLLTPFENPTSQEELRYNYSHAKTRALITQTFRILKSRFRCLTQAGGSLQYEPQKCAKITAACILLHNRCIQKGIPIPEIVDDEEPDTEQEYNFAIPNIAAQNIRSEILQQFFQQQS